MFGTNQDIDFFTIRHDRFRTQIGDNLKLLHRLVDGKETVVALIDAPQALTLRQEPKANVERYDTLRGKDVRHAS